MSFLSIAFPNDYGSEADFQAALDACYDGDAEACSSDAGQAFFDVFATEARKAGLQYVKDTDYGAIWQGTEEQIAAARATLPAWAYVGDGEDVSPRSIPVGVKRSMTRHDDAEASRD